VVGQKYGGTIKQSPRPRVPTGGWKGKGIKGQSAHVDGSQRLNPKKGDANTGVHLSATLKKKEAITVGPFRKMKVFDARRKKKTPHEG